MLMLSIYSEHKHLNKDYNMPTLLKRRKYFTKLNASGVAHHLLLALLIVGSVAGFGAYRVLYSDAATTNNWAEQRAACREYNAEAKKQRCLEEVDKAQAAYQQEQATIAKDKEAECAAANRNYRISDGECGGCKSGYYDKDGTCTARVKKDCAAENRRQLDDYNCGQCISGYYDTDASEAGVTCKQIESQNPNAIDPAEASRKECLAANRVWKDGACGGCKDGYVEKRGACKEKTSADSESNDQAAVGNSDTTTTTDSSGSVTGPIDSKKACLAANRQWNEVAGECGKCQKGYFDADKTAAVSCRATKPAATAIDPAVASEEECLAANRVWSNGTCGDCKEGYVEKRAVCREKVVESPDAEVEAEDNDANPVPDDSATTIDELEAEAIDGNFRIVVYTKKNFEGEEKVFTNSQASLGGLNDKISSFKIKQGRWQLCEDADFKKNCIKVWASATNLDGGKNSLNDKISSLRPVTDVRFEEASDDVLPSCVDAQSGAVVEATEDNVCPEAAVLACTTGYELKNNECKQPVVEADVVRPVDETFKGEWGEKKCLLLGREWIGKPKGKEINGGKYGCSLVTCNLLQDGRPKHKAYCISNKFDSPYAERMSQAGCEKLDRQYIEQVGMCAKVPNRKDANQTVVGAKQCKGSKTVYYIYKAADRNDTCYTPSFFQRAQGVVKVTGGTLGDALQAGPKAYCGIVKGGAFHWDKNKNACVKDPQYKQCSNGTKVLINQNCPTPTNTSGGSSADDPDSPSPQTPETPNPDNDDKSTPNICSPGYWDPGLKRCVGNGSGGSGGGGSSTPDCGKGYWDPGLKRCVGKGSSETCSEPFRDPITKLCYFQ